MTEQHVTTRTPYIDCPTRPGDGPDLVVTSEACGMTHGWKVCVGIYNRVKHGAVVVSMQADTEDEARVVHLRSRGGEREYLPEMLRAAALLIETHDGPPVKDAR